MGRIRWNSVVQVVFILIVHSVAITSPNTHVSISNIPPSTLFSAKHAPTNHTVTAPVIISPTEGSTIVYFLESLTIGWIEASDSEVHEFTYTLHYSWPDDQDVNPGSMIQPGSWNFFANIENGSSYIWDLPRIIDGIIYLRVTAVCSGGLTSEAIIQFELRHIIPPLIGIATIFFVLGTMILIILFPVLYKKRQLSSLMSINVQERDQFTLGIAIGLFDEKRGFRIEQKNKLLSSLVDDSEILSTLMYSARMYHPDKLDTLYGPFPIFGKEDKLKNWIFEVYWTKLIDKSSVDSRIIKNLMKIPIVLLFVYNQELLQIFEKRRKEIVIALQTAIVALKDVESLNENSCIMIQDHIIESLRISSR